MTSASPARTSVRALAGALALLAASPALVACGDDTDNAGEPKASTSASADASTGEPTAAATPEPAAGPEVEGRTMTYRLPVLERQEWKFQGSHRLSASINDPETTSIWVVTGSESLHGGLLPDTVDDAAQRALDNASASEAPLTRGPNRTVDGVEGYTVSNDPPAGQRQHLEWGTSYGGYYVSIEISGDGGEERSAEWLDAILAALNWTAAPTP